MKRTVSIVIGMVCVATALLFTACHLKKYDPSQIIGSWQETQWGCITIEDGEVVSESEFASDGRLWEFMEDGTFVFPHHAYHSNVGNTWKIKRKGVQLKRAKETLTSEDVNSLGIRYTMKYSPRGEAIIIDDNTIQVRFKVESTSYLRNEVFVENSILTFTLKRIM